MPSLNSSPVAIYALLEKTNEVISLIKSQQDFEELFVCLYHADRIVVMRAADCIVNVTLQQPVLLQH